jgi:hypothetical protein
MARTSRTFPRCFSARHAGFAIVLLALSGCHADITERLDFRPDGSGTMTVREAMDDQFAQMARAQSQDPFGIEEAKKNGWDVEQTLEDNGNHVVTLRRSFASGGANDAFHGTGLGQKTALRSVEIQQRGNPFSTTVRLRTTIPRLLPQDRTGNPWASAGANMAASIVSVHLVIAAPGRIDDTNGERASDGSVHWNVSLTEPTTIAMTVTYLNAANVVIAAAVVLIVLTAGVAWRVQRVQRARPPIG